MIEQTSISITASARISIFEFKNFFGHWNLHFSSFQITYVAKRFVATNREINLFRQECVTFLWAIEKLKAAIEQTSINITTNKQTQLRTKSFSCKTRSTDIIISCRKIESRDWTDYYYKHHNLGTNFDIFIAVSSKSPRPFKSTFY